MTRFARAKGSKSSNEKVPEEATPWSELKKGMLMKQEVISEETKKCVSALKSKTEVKEPPEWVSFDDENDDSLNILKKHLQKGKKTKGETVCDSSVNEVEPIVKNRKRKQTENVEDTVQKKKNMVDSQAKSKGIKNLHKEETCKRKIKDVAAEDKSDSSKILNKRKKEDCTVSEGNTTGKKKKKKNKNIPKTPNSEESNQNEVNEKIGKKKRKLGEKTKVGSEANKETEKLSKKKKMKVFAGEKSLKKKVKIANTEQNNTTKKGKTSKKDKKKINNDKMTINIGGEMVKLVKFQGFYVTEEDSKRLKELRKKMTEEGISQTQIEGAIKLERRRCEKALARMKKNVCFQCRKPGHVLSQCPEAQESVETATGVCYKCGSTEHKAFHCKVTKGQKFPFAECFICKEKGHIARECPDNPRGLYPKGGCCKICGDVTHLKKDCPKRISETEEKTIKLGVVDDRNLEGLDDGNEGMVSTSKKKQKRPVRF